MVLSTPQIKLIRASSNTFRIANLEGLRIQIMTNFQREIKDLLLKLFWRFERNPTTCQSKCSKRSAECLFLVCWKIRGREGGGGGSPAETHKPVQKGRKESPGLHRAPFKRAP